MGDDGTFAGYVHGFRADPFEDSTREVLSGEDIAAHPGIGPEEIQVSGQLLSGLCGRRACASAPGARH